jgi:hypothetical protein
MLKELLGEAFPLIEKFAPSVATLLGSPIAGAATSGAIAMLNLVFGGKEESTVANLATLVSQHPEVESKLKVIESFFSGLTQITGTPSNFEFSLKIGWPTQNGRGQS